LARQVDFTSHIVKVKRRKDKVDLSADKDFTSHIVKVKLLKEKRG